MIIGYGESMWIGPIGGGQENDDNDNLFWFVFDCWVCVLYLIKYMISLHTITSTTIT